MTTVGTAGRTCGVADYIMEEEFSRYNAHWWAPTASAGRLLYTVTDVTMLATISLVDRDNQIETMPFPKVGDPNAVSSAVVTEVPAGQAVGQHRILRWSAIKQAFPFAEYLTRLAWRGEFATVAQAWYRGVTGRFAARRQRKYNRFDRSAAKVELRLTRFMRLFTASHSRIFSVIDVLENFHLLPITRSAEAKRASCGASARATGGGRTTTARGSTGARSSAPSTR